MGCRGLRHRNGQPPEGDEVTVLPPLVVIVGPTAVGKSEFALSLAQEVNGEIVSADSMQVYRFMDIGTAKPTVDERKIVIHHLIDVVYPDERFSVADYQRMSTRVIAGIHGRKRIPLLTGGTGLYVNSVTKGYVFPRVRYDPVLRSELQNRAKQDGGRILHDRLKSVDPVAAKRIHPNDVRRIVRALEVFELTGRRLSELEGAGKVNYALIMVGLTAPREELYPKINGRVDRMIDRGLLDEVRFLLDEGYDESVPAMQGLGYKEMVQVVRGRCSLVEATRLFKRNTRHLAKRQWTWFTRDERIEWAEVLRPSDIEALTRKVSRLVREKYERWLENSLSETEGARSNGETPDKPSG